MGRAVRTGLVALLAVAAIPGFARAADAPDGPVLQVATRGPDTVAVGFFDMVGPVTGPALRIGADGLPVPIPGFDRRWVTAAAADGGTGWFVASTTIRRGLPSSIRHVHADGSIGPEITKFDGPVTQLALGSGRLYAVGEFSTADGVPARGAVALDPAALDVDPGWRAGLNDFAYGVGLVGPNVVVLGNFSTAGSAPRHGLAMLDGATGAPIPGWAPEIFGEQGACEPSDPDDPPTHSCRLVVAGSWIYTLGRFTTAPGHPDVVRIAVADGTLDTWAPAFVAHSDSSDPVLGGFITSLVPAGDRIVVGGDFDRVEGQTRKNLAAFDASTGVLVPWAPDGGAGVTSLTPAPHGDVIALLQRSTEGLAFSSGLVRIGPDGVSNPWTPRVGGFLTAVVASGPGTLVGGRFVVSQGTDRLLIAAYHGGQLRGSFAPTALSFLPTVVAIGSDRVYVGGFGATGAERLVALRRGDGARAPGFRAPVCGVVKAILPTPNMLWVGGEHLNCRGGGRVVLYGLDPRTGRIHITIRGRDTFEPDVSSLTLWPGRGIVVGGSFEAVAGQPRANLALIALDGRLRPWAPPMLGDPEVAVRGSRVYIGSPDPNGPGLIALDDRARRVDRFSVRRAITDLQFVGRRLYVAFDEDLDHPSSGPAVIGYDVTRHRPVVRIAVPAAVFGLGTVLDLTARGRTLVMAGTFLQGSDPEETPFLREFRNAG